MLPILLIAASVGASESPQLEDVNNLTSVVVGSGGDRPQVSIRFNTDGTIDEATGDTGSALSYSNTGEWLENDSAPGDNTDWEVQLTVDSTGGSDAGTFTGDAAASFHELSTNRTFTWTKDDNSLGDAIANITFEVRQKSATSNTDTNSVVFTAEITT